MKPAFSLNFEIWLNMRQSLQPCHVVLKGLCDGDFSVSGQSCPKLRTPVERKMSSDSSKSEGITTIQMKPLQQYLMNDYV